MFYSIKKKSRICLPKDNSHVVVNLPHVKSKGGGARAREASTLSFL